MAANLGLKSFNKYIICDSPSSNARIIVCCSICKHETSLVKKEYTRLIKRQIKYTDSYLCKVCLNKNEKYIIARNKSIKHLCNNDDWKKACSDRSKTAWLDPQIRERCINNTPYRSEEKSRKISNKIKAKFANDEEYKHKQAIARSNMPKISSLNRALYSILDNMGIKYFSEDSPGKECTIGPWNYDCVIPLKDEKFLVIEVQGEYWHSLEKSIRNDKAKSAYLQNFNGKYLLSRIFEHEFYQEGKVVQIIKNLLDVDNQVDFDFNNITITEGDNGSKKFLDLYHYLGGSRGGKYYNAVLNGEIIAVCVISPIIRQNINKDTVEISRFCIHPRYHKKNFGSWMISRIIKIVRSWKTYKFLLAYADTSVGHNGIIYKSCNFKLDSVVDPDYKYIDDRGWVMHKKTLYNRAVKLSMKERDYAEKFGFVKVITDIKYRYVFSIS